ncbi:MAG: peroxiredoxin [Alphaproteobacteria bacterium]
MQVGGRVDWSELPAPADDGAGDHLEGAVLPALGLPATDGRRVDLAALAGLSVVYAYPMTGRPDQPLPEGWDAIPGARGCTPEARAFRDHAGELVRLGVDHLFGLSTQTTAYQQEAAARLQLPFALLSDAELGLADALRLPTFRVEGRALLKRLTLVIRDGVVVRCFYPVFPPHAAPGQVIDWLAAGGARLSG